MREVITIGVGGFGINVTDTFTQGVAEEHGLTNPLNEENNELIENSYPDIFFEESSKGQWTSRGLLIDADSMGIDQIRSSRSGQELYGIDNFCCGRNSFGSLFAKGRYGDGKELVECAMDKIRGQIESCDCLQGFLFTYGLGGGAGSGMGTGLMEKIREEYPDRMMVTPILLPHAKHPTQVLEYYNAVLSVHSNVENCDFTLNFDNYQLQQYLQKKFQYVNGSLEDSNQILQDFLLNYTSMIRYHSFPAFNFRKVAVGLIPFPRIHFFQPYIVGQYSTFSEHWRTKYSFEPQSMIKEVFDFKSSLLNVNNKTGRSMTSFLNFRGSQISQIETLSYIGIFQKTTRTHKFIEWIPDNTMPSFVDAKVKLGGGKQIKYEGILIDNSNSIQTPFKQIGETFTQMFRRKAFLHYYTLEGMDEMEFTEAESNMNDLVSEYQQSDGCCCCCGDDYGEEEAQEDDDY